MSGPECCSNPPALRSSSGSGNVVKLGGFDSYVAGSANSKLAVVLASDIFGFEAPNLRKLADKVAAAGYYVAVPDFMHGDPYAPEDTTRPLPVWLKDHATDKGLEEAKAVIEDLRSKGFSSVGAAGFCWGAKVVVDLSKDKLIDAAAMVHPSFVSVEDVKDVKVPMAILGAEIDRMSPPELVKEFEEILNGKSEIECFVKIYPKVSHGWTVRYDVEDEVACKCAEEAHEDLINWFTKEVK